MKFVTVPAAGPAFVKELQAKRMNNPLPALPIGATATKKKTTRTDKHLPPYRKNGSNDPTMRAKWKAELARAASDARKKTAKTKTTTTVATAQEQFAKNGFYVTPSPVIPLPLINHLRRAIFSVYNGELSPHCAATPYEYDGWIDVVSKYNSAGVDTNSGLSLNKSVLKMNNSWWINNTIRDFLMSSFFHEQIGGLAADLLSNDGLQKQARCKSGRPLEQQHVDCIRLWHDQAIIKPGNSGSLGNIGWHRDYDYWQISSSTKMITALIMLQDSSAENGTLMTVSDSHRWTKRQKAAATKSSSSEKKNMKSSAPPSPPSSSGPSSAGGFDTSHDPGFFSQMDLAESKKQWMDEFGEPNPEIVTNNVVAGQVMFHHSLTIHGSGPNVSNTPRLALAVHMQSGDHCRLRGGPGTFTGFHHNLRDLGPYGAGRKNGDERRLCQFDGEAFPILFQRPKKPQRR